MANEAEQAIYQRLLQAAAYHPGSAELFADDWALEPGDVVTVQSASEDYSLPIFNMKLDWTGQSMVNVEATGNKERAPLPELKRRRYSGGRAAHEETKELDEKMTIRFLDDENQIGMVVEKDSQGQPRIRVAQIVLAINDDNSTSAIIDADHVSISGNTTLYDTMTIQNGNLLVKRAALFGETPGQSVSINDGKVNAPTLQVNSNGKLIFVGTGSGEHYDVDVTAAKKIVSGFGASSASGGTITIPFYTIGAPSGSSSNVITFNIADTEYYQDHVGIDALSLVNVSQSDYEQAQCAEKTVTDNSYYITSVMANDGSTSQFKFHTPDGAAGVTIVPDDSSITSEASTDISVQKGTTTYSSQGSISVSIRFTLSNGKRYRRSAGISVGATRIGKQSYTLRYMNNNTGAYTTCSEDHFYYMN